MSPFNGLGWTLVLVTVFGISRTTAIAIERIDNVDGLFNSMTNNILGLLDQLQVSHGDALDRVLTLLLERVRRHAVTEEEASVIRDVIAFVDVNDPKVQAILDIVGKIAPTVSVDEILMSAFDVFDDLSKSGGGPTENVPRVGFEGDNRTYVVSELDILIPEEQIELEKERRVKRKAVIDEEQQLWKRGIIPYHIDFSSTVRYSIMKAMKHWEHYTCLEFREKRPDDFNVLLIHGDGRGCFSNTGQIGRTSHLVLSDGCYKIKTIIHELGHAIGLYHEHTRTDRDEYVEIKFENIINITYYDEFSKLREKHPIEDTVPYDYRSIMHYGTYFYSKKKPEAKTIVTIDPNFQDVIGKAKWASFDDIKTVSLLYKCAEGCKPKKCPDDGFQGKRCKCWCRGPGDHIPVEECEKEVGCSAPPVNMAVYQIWRYVGNERVLEFPLDIPSGTKFKVDLVDLRCGDDLTIIQCFHGEWDLPLPECKPDPCFLEPEWLDIYNIEVKPEPELPDGDILQADITHGSILKLTCISELEREKSLECQYGNWTDQPQLCPEIGGRCLILNSTSTLSILETTGQVLQPGETVNHGDTVQVMCDPDITLGTQYDLYDILETNVTCYDGKLMGELPICPEPPIPCPDVPHSLSYIFLPPYTYNVTCLGGYELETDRSYFDCDSNGTWLYPVPKCIAKSCKIPPRNVYNGLIKDVNGVILSEDTQVRSGDSVKYVCPPGSTPDHLELTCNAQRWDTETGALPVCQEVICHGRPPVRHVSYSPRVWRYMYGDEVTINRCRGNLEAVGPNKIKCQANGTWSGSFYCRKFCDGGTIKEIQYPNHKIIAKPVHSYTHIGTLKKCKQKCIKQKRFLCLSYLFGYDFDISRWVCQLFKIDPSKDTRLLQPKYTLYVFARTCIE